jgi:hypothetical protein
MESVPIGVFLHSAAGTAGSVRPPSDSAHLLAARPPSVCTGNAYTHAAARLAGLVRAPANIVAGRRAGVKGKVGKKGIGGCRAFQVAEDRCARLAGAQAPAHGHAPKGHLRAECVRLAGTTEPVERWPGGTLNGTVQAAKALAAKTKRAGAEVMRAGGRGRKGSGAVPAGRNVRRALVTACQVRPAWLRGWPAGVFFVAPAFAARHNDGRLRPPESRPFLPEAGRADRW